MYWLLGILSLCMLQFLRRSSYEEGQNVAVIISSKEVFREGGAVRQNTTVLYPIC